MRTDKPMPHNNDIERAVLAGILKEPALIDSAIADKFSANCFYSHINREIWKACSHMHGNGEALDLLSVANCLKMAGTLEKVGGDVFLAELHTSIATTVNFRSWIGTLVKLAAKRQLIEACSDTMMQSYEDSRKVKELIAEHSGKVSLINSFAQCKSRDMSSVLKATNQMFKDGVNGQQIIRYCIPAIDTAIIHARKQMHVLSAQPGVGKTAFALSAIAKQIQNGIIPVIFCKESSSEEITGKIISILSGIPYITLLTSIDKLTKAQFQAYNFAIGTLKKYEKNLFVFGGGDYQHSVAGINGALLRLKNECGRVDAVYIDYIQNMLPPPHLSKKDKTPQIDYNIEALKDSFIEYDCAGTVLSQINREGAKAGRPAIHHLKYSGTIEQEAHIISFLHRDNINDPKQSIQETDWYSAKTRLFAPFGRKLIFKKSTAEYCGRQYEKEDRPGATKAA